jgi:DNA topoisomerase-2
MERTQTVEQKYRKVNLHKHILKRGNMYLGSLSPEKAQLWVCSEDSGFVRREVEYVPALYKIFDEILINARDHYVRTHEEALEPCTIIKVNIENDQITIWNNGAGIEVCEHKKYGVYIPTLIFGELLSSSNYNDHEQRRVGGVNGLGAKLTNIYSQFFEVETLDAVRGKKFYQKFSKNMYHQDSPIIKLAKGSPFTRISFLPDYVRFGLTGLTPDMLALFKRRVYDVAMNTRAKVYYNGELIRIKSFEDYVQLYYPGDQYLRVVDVSNPEWRVAVVYDPAGSLENVSISFVNGIATHRGGTHVDHVAQQIVSRIRMALVQKMRNKNMSIKPSLIREHLAFFVDCIIVNPEFDTQTKECLRTRPVHFGGGYRPPESFIRKIIKSGIVEQLISLIRAREEALLTHSRLQRTVRIEKLYDAHKAHLRRGDCTLILTEGDSAKTFALSGLNAIGRDYYGVFPLRGKLLNVRDESPAKVAANEEIRSIVQIIGLEYKKEYRDVQGLRYGSIMVLTDADVDGSHIKGLIINFVHYFWPSLARLHGFIRSLRTPLVKATRGREVLEFANLAEFEKWQQENPHGWHIKYYKGLGTSTPAEAQACFSNIEERLVLYHWPKAPALDPELSRTYTPKLEDLCEDAITLAFAKRREDDRKIWLNTYDLHKFLERDQKEVGYHEFIHRELIAFSVYDTYRSIPNMVDGFKPGQRKVYFASVRKNIYHQEIKVAQLSGYISETTHYHHGEQSLNDTIIRMAQNFVGSNNLSLLVPRGQFGSRLAGGRDAASPRYIFTQLDTIGRSIFIEDDFDVLQQQYEDGDPIEPIFYVPILPMVLVNGADGIGTGYSTKIKPCNPWDICRNLKRMLHGKKPREMAPWYRHFTGRIEKIGPNKYVARANYQVRGDRLQITDLPVGVWTDDYKAFLDQFLDKNNKRKNPISADIRGYQEDCTEIRVDFTIIFRPGTLAKYTPEILEKCLRLKTPINLTNMHLFDEYGHIKKYTSYQEILEDFVRVRRNYYQKRRQFLLQKWRHEAEQLGWRLRFVEYVIDGKIIVFQNGRSEKVSRIIQQLQEHKFPLMNASYDYLTSMSILKFSQDELQKLRRQVEEYCEKIARLEAKTIEEMWMEELDQFMEAYRAWEERDEQGYQELLRKPRQKRRK